METIRDSGQGDHDLSAGPGSGVFGWEPKSSTRRGNRTEGPRRHLFPLVGLTLTLQNWFAPGDLGRFAEAWLKSHTWPHKPPRSPKTNLEMFFTGQLM